MLSSRGDKGEGKVATRLDVLAERVDTLASTVATTASAMAKRDGEIAALRKELDARDQRLVDFVSKARETADGSELRELKEAVAALASDRTRNGGGSSGEIADLSAKVMQLRQRLETVSTTVSTTAAGLAGRDGELAALRKQLERAPAPTTVRTVAAPDGALIQRVGDLAADLSGAKAQLETLVQQVAALATRSEQAPIPVELTERVGHLTDDMSGARQLLADLSEKIVALESAARKPREEVPSAVTERIGALAADATGTRQQLETLSQEVAALKAFVEQHAAEASRPSEEIRGMLAALRTKVEELGELTGGVTEEQLDERFARADEGVETLARRVESLATTIDAAVTDIAAKEAELAVLHRHFMESNERIESVAADIRTALSAFPQLGSASTDDLAARLERVVERVERAEAMTRDHASAGNRLAGELSHRIGAIEDQVTAVAGEVARAKTLWPVALRSLEARLEDVSSHGRELEPAETTADDDLLAGLRDSLQAMETVAAEMARASDVLTTPEELEPAHEAVAAGGATIVPLRSSDP